VHDWSPPISGKNHPSRRTEPSNLTNTGANLPSQPVNAPVQKNDLAKRGTEATVFAIILAISFSHLLNDTIQSLLSAIYPILKESFRLDFGQIGLITFVFQITASLLQPLVGLYTDHRPKPFSLPIGMGFTLVGLLLLSVAPTYPILLLSAGLIGVGSSIFHPESSRVARMASGGRHGLAQSVFQVGGNTGSAIGPLLAAAIVVPHGQGSIAWFSLVALVAIGVLSAVSIWYRRHRPHFSRDAGLAARERLEPLPRKKVIWALVVLGLLVFSKHFYLASVSSYYTFYLISKFGVSVQAAQIDLFIFLFAAAAGIVVGGLVGDRFGRKYVIWVSILGVLPFTLALPFVGLPATIGLSVVIGLILSSAFSAIVVFAQELVPGKVGMISGLFFGLAFGMGGLGAAVLGALADVTSIEFVYKVCAFLPAIGLLTAFLPNLERPKR
jgi:FSR family fosmidomycin resistance protein-like MFS transporter